MEVLILMILSIVLISLKMPNKKFLNFIIKNEKTLKLSIATLIPFSLLTFSIILIISNTNWFLIASGISLGFSSLLMSLLLYVLLKGSKENEKMKEKALVKI